MPEVRDADDRTVRFHVAGDAEPTTVFAHAWGENATSLRPLAAGLPGRRVFVELHDDDRPWSYAQHARAIAAVLSHWGADRAVGQSMGAGALLRLLRSEPVLLRHVVLMLPPAPHRPPGPGTAQRLRRLHEARTAADRKRLADAVADCLPEHTRSLPLAPRYVAASTARLLATRAAAADPADYPWRGLPVADGPGPDVRALVIGQDGDRIHDPADARTVADHLPHAELRIYAAEEPVWGEPAELRSRLGRFLAGAAT